MSIQGLYKLGIKDLDRSVEVCAKAFIDYPTFPHVLGKKYNAGNLKKFIRFLTKYAILYGEAYASSEKIEGVILACDFDRYDYTLYRSLRCGILSLIRLGKDVRDRFNKFDKFTLKIHEKNIRIPHKYIIMMGVDPEKQGQGYGRKMMTEVLKDAGDKGRPCYLETHGEKNVAIYKKLGFEIISENIMPDTDIVQYAMIKR